MNRRPTIIDIAQAAGVSKSLVSLALSGRPGVAEGTRTRILAAADELGYTRNNAARTLVSGRTHLLGVIATDVTSSYNIDVITGIEDAAADAGYSALLTHGRRDPEVLARRIDELLSVGVDALAIVSSRVSLPALTGAAKKVPVAVIGRPETVPAEVDLIHNDDAAGGRLAVEHLLSLGHRRIGFVSTSTRKSIREREQAYDDTLRAAGIEERFIVRRDEDNRAALPGQVIKDLILADDDSVPTALFVATDNVAVATMGEAMDQGLYVPEDLSIVGYNDTALARAVRPTLSSVNQSRSGMGRAAVECVLERLAGERASQRVEVFDPVLEVRGSTARP